MNKNYNFISGTVLVAIFSLLGYLIAFFYEYGYLGYFHIPKQLIEVSLINILIGTVATLGTMFLLLTVLNIFSQIGLLNTKTALGRSRNFALMYVAYAVIMLLIYQTAWKQWLWVLIVAAVILIIEFLWPFIFQKDKKTLEEKFLAQEKIEREVLTNDLFGRISEKMGRSMLQFLFLSVVLLSIAFNMGRSEALNQTSFVLLGLNSNKAVIRIYSQNLIVIEFDRESKRVANSFLLINRDNFDESTPLITEEIGPLIID